MWRGNRMGPSATEKGERRLLLDLDADHTTSNYTERLALNQSPQVDDETQAQNRRTNEKQMDGYFAKVGIRYAHNLKLH
jgi:hypothetical protein